VDVTHVLDAGLAGRPDAEVLAQAAAEDRIVVTRNYADFARLIEAYQRRNQPFPGVLFLPVSLSAADVGAHVEAVELWVATNAARESPVRNGFGWLTLP
jgi:predicted nuclease of predicted toxin-antitoxin system